MRRPPTSVSLAVALALVLAVGGCGGDEPPSGGSPTTTASTPGATTTGDFTVTTSPVDETAAVLKAYADHWPVFDAFLSGKPPGDPADYFAGVRLTDLPRSVADFAEKGLEIHGQAQLDPGEVTIDGSRASFTDCHLDSTSAVSKNTGEVVFAPATEPKKVAVELVKVAGVWKVSSVVYSEVPCVQ